MQGEIQTSILWSDAAEFSDDLVDCGQMSELVAACFLEKIQTLDIEFSVPKRKGTVQTSVSSHRMGDVHMCEGTAEAYIWTVQKHLLSWK